jgi:hypothetical protein
MAVSSTSIKVASMTETAMSQGLIPRESSAEGSGGAVAAVAMEARSAFKFGVEGYWRFRYLGLEAKAMRRDVSGLAG